MNAFFIKGRNLGVTKEASLDFLEAVEQPNYGLRVNLPSSSRK